MVIVPFLEDVLVLGHRKGWMRVFERLGTFFTTAFGSDWQKSEKTFWEDVSSGNYKPEPIILKK